MSAKLKRAVDGSGQHIGWNFICPGCGKLHHIRTETGPTRWQFNGNVEAPTFSPSVRVWDGQGYVCHFFIVDGIVKFCGDSTHEFAGKDVPLNELDLTNPYLRDPGE